MKIKISFIIKVLVNMKSPIANTDWFIGNLYHSGWYRVNYDKENWNLLIKQLIEDDHEVFDLNARAQLLDDSFNLGRAELIEQTIFLDISKYLKKETSPMPFSPVFTAFSKISSLIVNEFETFELFKVKHF